MSSAKSCPVNFDHYSPDYAARWIDILRTIRSGPNAVAWNENYGGFWVVTRYADAQAVARDDVRFSAAKTYDDKGCPVTGAIIPSGGPPAIPFENDPPKHAKYRALFAPLLTPSAVNAREPQIRALVDACIDSIIEAGQGDLVLDIASMVPAVLTCEMLGFDRRHARRFSELLHKMVYIPAGTPERIETDNEVAWLAGQITVLMADRRKTPRDDVISHFVHAKVDGQTVSEDEAMAMIMQFIGGGVDTTASLTSTALMYLHEHPEARAWLQEDPARMPAAVDEFLRFYSTAQYVGRTVVKETEIGGQVLKPGEQVMVSWAAANHDPAQFETPDEIKLDRFAKGGWHMGFGMGSHTCQGMHLGRLETRIMLTEILRRLPDYRVVPGGAHRYGAIGTINGWIKIPVTFTPGKKRTA
jgi:cytochrome P450